MRFPYELNHLPLRNYNSLTLIIQQNKCNFIMYVPYMEIEQETINLIPNTNKHYKITTYIPTIKLI